MEDLFGKMQELLSDPESMKQISELAQMLQSDMDAPSAPPPAETEAPADQSGPAFDPIMLLKISELMNSTQKPDENTALLLALRPHLKAQRQERVDKAVRLLRLMHVFSTLKESGMLHNLL